IVRRAADVCVGTRLPFRRKRAVLDDGIRSAELVRGGAEPADLFDRPKRLPADERVKSAPRMRERVPDDRQALGLAAIAAGTACVEEVEEVLRVAGEKRVVADE